MAISDEITRLQTAKADLKTAIENKGVSVPSNATLDDYPALVDSIEQGGGAVPYIVNPLNGDIFGDENGGTYTHQYVIANGNIVECSLVTTFTGDNMTASSINYPGSYYLPNHQYSKEYLDVSRMLTITDSGLLTLTIPAGQDEYIGGYMCLIKTDSNVYLVDEFSFHWWYTCFIKGTKISLANGETISVEDVDYNDDLLVWNFDEGKYDSAKPLWIKKTETTTWYYKLKFSNGLELKVTGTYPEAHSLFSVEDGKFIHANKLVGKKVYTLDSIATLESCEEIHEEVEFYNIFTYYHLNLFANDVLTSTSLNNIYPIKNMKFVKTQREPVFDYTKFSDDWIVGARLKEQPTDVTEYCLDHIKLSKTNLTTQK